MKYKVGVTVQVELETEAPNEQDAIVIAMSKTEEAVQGMKVRRHWWEYVKEASNENTERKTGG